MRARSLAWAALVAALAGSLCRVVEHDAPWYLAAGELLLRTRALPARDPFSFTSHQPWLNHEWLSEVLLALGYRAGGWIALSLLCAVVVAAALAVAAWGARTGVRGAAAWALCFVVLRENLAPRATLFAALAFVAVLALVLRDEDAPSPRLWWCVPIQLLLTQLHGGNPLAVLLLGLHALAAPSRRRGLVALATALATIVGPYGVRVHAHFLGAHAALPLIREWQPLAGPLRHGSLSAWAALALCAAAALASSIRLRRAPGAKDARFALAAVLLFGAAMLRWSRFATEASLVAAATLAPALARLRLARPIAWTGAALGVVLAALGPRTPGLGLDPRAFPQGAVAWLRAHRPPGPMLNSYNFGGYLLWAYPEERVFVDGRAFTVYDEATIAALPAIYADPDRFAALDARWRFRLAVLQRAGRGAGFDAWLAARPGWRLAYRDAVADVLVRDP